MQQGRLLFGQDIYSDRERKMIQGRLQSNFKMKSERKDNDNTVIDGELTCCDANSFAVYAYGTMKYSLFSGMYLFPGNEGLALEVSCKKCGKRINIFNSNVDGYDGIVNGQDKHPLKTEAINCKKCSSNDFSLNIRYEYPDMQELLDDGITQVDNAFTWIWISLRCNKCGTIYKKFVDYETT